MPAAVEVLRLHANQRAAWLVRNFGSRLAADRRAHREYVMADEPHASNEKISRRRTARCGREPRRTPGRRAMSRGASTTSMAMSAPELPTPTTSTGPSASCDGFLYSFAMQLDDGGIELVGECAAPWLLEVRHRDDDVVGFEVPVAGGHDGTAHQRGRACRRACSCGPEVRNAERRISR